MQLDLFKPVQQLPKELPKKLTKREADWLVKAFVKKAGLYTKSDQNIPKKL